MKHKLIVALVLVAMYSCNEESQHDSQLNPYQIDVRSMGSTSEISDITITIRNSEGLIVDGKSVLKQGSHYTISFESKDAEFIRIKNGKGFKIIETPLVNSQIRRKSEYRIFTTADMPGQVYINAICIHQKDNVYVKERSQVFLLPK
jgi:hypothetical protein